jgi:hypothetical protein
MGEVVPLNNQIWRKKMKSILLVSIMCFGYFASAAEVVEKNSATGVATESAVLTCKELIAAAKADNFEAVSSMMIFPDHGKTKMAMNKKNKMEFEKMHKENMAAIRDMTCGSELIAGDRAMVTAMSKDEERLIPFIQKDGKWKFDMKTYRAFYRDGHKEMKSM